MNLFSSLRTIVPLITLMTGVLLPTNITLAASSATTNKASLKQEIVKAEEQTVEDHQTGEIPQLFFSQKAQQIELLILLSTIFLITVVPELFYKPNKNSKSLKSSEKPKNRGEQINKTEPDILETKNNIKHDIVSLKVIRKNKKTSSLVADNLDKLNNQEKIEIDAPMSPFVLVTPCYGEFKSNRIPHRQKIWLRKKRLFGGSLILIPPDANSASQYCSVKENTIVCCGNLEGRR